MCIFSEDNSSFHKKLVEQSPQCWWKLQCHWCCQFSTFSGTLSRLPEHLKPGEYFRLKLNGNLLFVQLSIDRIHRNWIVLKIGWDFENLSNFKILNTFILIKWKDSTILLWLSNQFWYHFFLRIVWYIKFQSSHNLKYVIWI